MIFVAGGTLARGYRFRGNCRFRGKRGSSEVAVKILCQAQHFGAACVDVAACAVLGSFAFQISWQAQCLGAWGADFVAGAVFGSLARRFRVLIK